MSLMPPFTPGPTTSASSSGSASAATALPCVGQQARIVSASGGTQVLAFIKFGDSTVAATTSDTPIIPGSDQIFTPPSVATHFSVIAASASATTIRVTSGIGE